MNVLLLKKPITVGRNDQINCRYICRNDQIKCQILKILNNEILLWSGPV